jgi:ankyrin repeat protein
MINRESSEIWKFLQSFEAMLESAESKAVSLTQLNSLFVKVKEIAVSDSGTALHFIAGLGFTKIVRALINHGYDVNALTINGLTPLHMATLFKHHSVCKLLLQSGALIDPIEHKGKTPLHIASFNNSPDLVELLLKFGANYLIKTPENFTAAQIAITKDYKEVLIVFKDHFIANYKTASTALESKPKIIVTPNYSNLERILTQSSNKKKTEELEPCDSPFKF